MFRYEEVSILEGSVLGPGPHYWGLGAQQTKARPAKRYRKCIFNNPCHKLISITMKCFSFAIVMVIFIP